jgi:hypothetical protein
MMLRFFFFLWQELLTGENRTVSTSGKGEPSFV